ncbi:MAG: NADH-quinone oxidoreductase subunit J [Nevskiales bacterium]
MQAAFYLSGMVALAATFLTIVSARAVHALLYLILSLLAVAVTFYTLGAPFIAALEVIVYAGAIVVLFIFVVMLLNLGEPAVIQERSWLSPRIWVGPSLLALILLCELVYLLWSGEQQAVSGKVVDARAVGLALYGPYLLVVELASMLLTAGLVGAYHLMRDSAARKPRDYGRGQLP